MIAVLQGLLLTILGLLAPFFVPLFLLAHYTPWWLITPDDPVSPYGRYEQAVVAVYARWGKFAGDYYWLALRNAMYGLAYYLKPDWLKGLDKPYSRLTMRRTAGKHWQLIEVYGADFELTVYVGPLAIIMGRRLSPIWNNVPGQLPRAINMDGRPIFSVRMRRQA